MSNWQNWLRGCGRGGWELQEEEYAVEGRWKVVAELCEDYLCNEHIFNKGDGKREKASTR